MTESTITDSRSIFSHFVCCHRCHAYRYCRLILMMNFLSCTVAVLRFRALSCFHSNMRVQGRTALPFHLDCVCCFCLSSTVLGQCSKSCHGFFSFTIVSFLFESMDSAITSKPLQASDMTLSVSLPLALRDVHVILAIRKPVLYSSVICHHVVVL